MTYLRWFSRILFFPFLFLGGIGYSALLNTWTYPTADSVYNPNSTENFEKIRFEGFLFDDITGVGFFTENGQEIQPSVVNVSFDDGNSSIIVDVLAETNVLIDFNGMRYQFEISVPTGLNDGEVSLEVYFEIPTNPVQTTNIVWSEKVKIDTTPPILTFSYLDSGLNPINGFTNQPSKVTVSCSDTNECYPQNFASFEVKGNFSNIFENGVRGVEICDIVGNCTDFSQEVNKVSIEHYDPIPPTLSSISLTGNSITRNGTGSFSNEALKAQKKFTFQINSNDIESVNELSYPNLFDENACGSESSNNDIFLGQEIIMSWQTTNEGVEFGQFEIQRSLIGQNDWKTVGYLEGGKSNYTFSTLVPNQANNYEYRLAVFDSSIGYEYSPIVQIGQSPIGLPFTFSNPVNVVLSSLSVNSGSSRCANKEKQCVISAIERDWSENRHTGTACSFQKLPSGGISCDSSQPFPLCLPFDVKESEKKGFPLNFPHKF